MIIPFKVEAKDYKIMLSYFANGGTVASGNVEIISGVVFVKNDVKADITYNSNQTIAHINSLDGTNTFTLKKGGNLQTKTKEWYAINYNNGKYVYFDNSKSYKVSDIIKKLDIDTSYYEKTGSAIEIYMQANYGKNVSVDKVTLNSSAVKIKAGKTTTIKATITPSKATDKSITWSSSNSKVVTVDSNGKIKGISKGNATITAKSSNGKTAVCSVTVVDDGYSGHYVNIHLNANGGKLFEPYSSAISISNDVVYKNGKIYTFKIPYGEKTSYKGLPNYNGNKAINIIRALKETTSGEEWNTKADGSGKVYSQTKQYNASDFCDASNADCEVILYVNWKDPKDTSNGLSDIQKKAIKETSLAYYRKKSKIQYSTGRKENFSPEDATSEQKRFSVCSNFVNNVYREVFGIDLKNAYDFSNFSTGKITRMAKSSNYKKYGIIKRYPNGSFDKIKSKSCSDIKSELKLETGDLLNWTNNEGTQGHVVLVVNTGGNNYNIYQSVKHDGSNNIYSFRSGKSIEINDAKDGSIDELELCKYVKMIKSGKYVSVYRPADDTSINISFLTPAAKTRTSYPGLSIDKSEKSSKNSLLDNMGYVDSNDTITYILTIYNNSSSNYKNSIKVVETISNGEIISAASDGNVSGNKVTWNVNVPKNGKVSLSYSVKVKGISGSKIISKGHVGDVKTATIENRIYKALTEQEENKIVSLYKNNKYSGQDTLSRVNKVYKELYGVSLGLTNASFKNSFNGNKGVKGNLIDMMVDGYYHINKIEKVKNDSEKMYYYSVIIPTYPNSPKIRYPNADHLKIGDVLIYYDNYKGTHTVDSSIKDDCKNAYCSYMYIGDKTFLGYNKDGDKIYYKTGEPDELHNHFSSLMGKQKYMIFRPSLRFKK